MPKIVCVDCQCEFKPETNGTIVVETASFGPYKLWEADTWKCPGCSKEVVCGFGQEPIVEHHDPRFSEVMMKEINSGSRIEYDRERPVAKPSERIT